MNNTIAKISISGYQIQEPIWLLLLLLLPLITYLLWQKVDQSSGSMRVSAPKEDFSAYSFVKLPQIIKVNYAIFSLGIAMLIIALARPLDTEKIGDIENYGEGIDIVISMDISGSMLATDFQPNRLVAAKELAKEFVELRKSDRIGLVVYEGEAYTPCPVTKNHDFLKKTLSEIESGWLESGTAIGVGLGTAVNRVNIDSLSSKVIILLSDGENNRGEISPMEAAELAKSLGIRVYTIGVGSEGYASMPVNTPFGTIMQNTLVSIDEELLTAIAEMTGGSYFRATDEKSLREIYYQINQLEKNTYVDVNLSKDKYVHPEFFLLFGLGTLVFSLFANLLIYRAHA
ncbi:MAG: VWA domain-containing protein [Crocinitomicaceae bacterium]|nr:VWA domain-containing protein [Crocinitomicaceae bacterium]